VDVVAGFGLDSYLISLEQMHRLLTKEHGGVSIVLLGGTGFLGAHVARRLLVPGERVVAALGQRVPAFERQLRVGCVSSTQ